MNVAGLSSPTTIPIPITAVLLVEDNRDDAGFTELQLPEARGFDVTRVERVSEAVEQLSRQTFSVILLDLSLADAQWMETFASVRAAASDVPVVVLTGVNDDRIATAVVECGAQDYIVKSDATESQIVRRIRYAMERHRLATDSESIQRRESELKDRFLSHVSHELRSPLAVSLLCTTNVLDGLLGELNPAQHAHLSLALEAVGDQQRLIEDLLATVRCDASQIALERHGVSLAEVIDESVRGLEAARVTIVNERSMALPIVYGDRHRIRQILTRVIENALTFTSSHGQVRVRAFTSPTEPGFVQVDVDDDGSKTPDGRSKRIFNRLSRFEHADGDKHGLGVGLYLSRLLIVRHGGRVWVEPIPDGGSRLSFTLPFVENQAA